jgi:hypothetical protein
MQRNDPAALCTVRQARTAGFLCTVLVLAAGLTASAATLEITGPVGAPVRVNGLQLSNLPLAGPLTLAPGKYVVECEMKGYAPFSKTVLLEDDTSHVLLQIRPVRLSRRTAWMSSVLYAGLGQFYLGQRTRGWIYAAAETGGLVAALAGELQRSNYRQDYLVLMDAYRAGINAEEVTYYREQAASTYAKMEDAEKLRDTGLVVVLAAIGLSVADALLTFPGVEAGPGPAPPPADIGGLIPDLGGGGPAAHVAVKLSF